MRNQSLVIAADPVAGGDGRGGRRGSPERPFVPPVPVGSVQGFLMCNRRSRQDLVPFPVRRGTVQRPTD
jgi:hypothetical protein